MSLEMMRVAHCGVRLVDNPGFKDMLHCGSTLRGSAEDASGVAYGVFTLGDCLGAFCCCGLSFVGGITCGGAAMLNISEICFRAPFFLFCLIF